MKKKRALTLLEIMIVIALITLITGVIGYNMRDTLDRGRAFRTEQAIEQVRDMLLLCVSDGKRPRDMLESRTALVNAIKSVGMAKDPIKILQDGWGNPLVVEFDSATGDFLVTSQRLEEYRTAHK